MLRVIVSMKDRVLAERTFDQPRISVGRAVGNDLQLENPVLSRRHAEMVKTPMGWVLGDLGSSNGLHVNGLRTSMHRLNDGDVIALGKFTLEVRFKVEGGSAPCVFDIDGYLAQGRTLALGPSPSPPALVPPTAQISVSAPHEVTYKVKRDAFRIGGGSRCDLKLTGLLVPQHMAMVVRGRSGFSLVNVSPDGEGVFRNGRPVPGRAWLRDGDRFEVGDVLACFRTEAGCL